MKNVGRFWGLGFGLSMLVLFFGCGASTDNPGDCVLDADCEGVWVCRDGRCVEPDPCDGVDCNTPPADYCDGDSLVVYAVEGTCADGSCSYTSQTELCDDGCSNGACNGDPCAGVDCNTPPPAECITANTRQFWTSPGTCENGVCDYPMEYQECEFGCAEGVCSACTPDCVDKECGSNGCGGTCGSGCGVDEICNETTYRCVTVGVFVAAGPCHFSMGSPESEVGRASDEVQHSVSLSNTFTMLSTEVTQGQFETLMGYNPSQFSSCGTNCPVEQVNWYEAAAYCNALSATAGFMACYTCTGTGVDVVCEPDATYATPYECPGYRLPTEAEWECAARALYILATYNGDLRENIVVCEQPNNVLDSIAWFCGNSGDMTHAVGTRDPNDWYLYDMLGNVGEWCHDWYGDYSTEPPVVDPWGVTTGYSRVARGGSWYGNAWYARAAIRGWIVPGLRLSNVGFRPVRSDP